MSFREIAVTIRAVNRASGEFSRISADASAMGSRVRGVQTTLTGGFVENAAAAELFASKVRTLSGVIAGLGAAGVAIGHIAHQFGLLNAEQARVFNSAMMVVSALGMFMRTSIGVAIAQKVYSAACWIATAAQNALNISYATFLALTGVGIAVIIAAAAAMWSFASSMNAATSSVQGFNAATSEVPEHGRSIQRAGELDLARRGVE